jgi:hypothetical protein
MTVDGDSTASRSGRPRGGDVDRDRAVLAADRVLHDRGSAGRRRPAIETAKLPLSLAVLAPSWTIASTPKVKSTTLLVGGVT